MTYPPAYQPKGFIEALAWVKTFVDVSSKPDENVQSERAKMEMPYLAMLDECSQYLAQRVPQGTLIWMDRPACRFIQKSLDITNAKGATSDMELLIGHHPIYVAYAEPIRLAPDGQPMHSFVVADGRLCAMGRRSENYEPYLEYWHWTDGMVLSEAIETIPVPSTNMIQHAVVGQITAAVIGNAEEGAGFKVTTEKTKTELDRLVAWWSERNVKLMAPAGGMVTVTAADLVPLDGQHKGWLN